MRGVVAKKLWPSLEVIRRRAARDSERQKSANTTRSKVRARVHIFGQWCGATRWLDGTAGLLLIFVRIDLGPHSALLWPFGTANSKIGPPRREDCWVSRK